MVNFSKTTHCTCPTDSCNFVVFGKFTRGHLHQIAFEIMLLVILIVMLIITTINQCTYHISIYDCEREKILRWWVRHIRISCCHSKNCAAWTDVLQLKESFLKTLKWTQTSLIINFTRHNLYSCCLRVPDEEIFGSLEFLLFKLSPLGNSQKSAKKQFQFGAVETKILLH